MSNMTATIIYFIALTLWIHVNAEGRIEKKCAEFLQCNRSFEQPPLVIMGLDGFRNGFLKDKQITPTIQKLIDCGTNSKYMRPTFPSKTFPNFYAIATGLYPKWSGIVDNRFYDTEKKILYTVANRSEGWFLGEPIWNTVQKAGKKSATFFWPGSDVAGNHPTYWKPFNMSVPLEERIDQLVAWLNMDDENRPSSLQVYIQEPDVSEHKFGPYSKEAKDAVALVDRLDEYFIKKLQEQNLMGCINLILLSDHGMQSMDPKETVVVNSLLKKNFEDIFTTGVVAQMYINESLHKSAETALEELNESIKSLKCKKEFRLYKKNNLPVRLHYGDSFRMGEYLFIGEPGRIVCLTNEQKEKYHALGDHGYDNRLQTMRAMFIAIGPDIAVGKKIDEFQNIELNNLFARLLRITPASNNGTEGVLYPVFKNPPEYPFSYNRITLPDCALTEQVKTTCPNLLPVITATVLTTDQCIEKTCNAYVQYDRTTKETVLIKGFLTSESLKSDTQEIWMEYDDDKRKDKLVKITPFMKNTREIPARAFFTVPKDFANSIWKFLVKKIKEYLKEHNELYFLSGPVFDVDGDGLRDDDSNGLNTSREGVPTHIFFIFLWCNDGTSLSNNLCKDIKFLPYVLPVESEDMNCFTESDYLSDNIARLRDIELLTGLEFFANRTVWDVEKALQLRTLLPTAAEDTQIDMHDCQKQSD